MPSQPEKPKPLLDEAAFQQLLEAAHVLQQHNDAIAPPSPSTEPPRPEALSLLAQIVATQRKIQSHTLDLPEAATLVAEQVRQLTPASGVAVGVLSEGEMAYVAACGSAAKLLGTHIDLEHALCAQALQTGETIWLPDTGTVAAADFLRSQNLLSLIAIPLAHDGKVAGVLELHGAQPNAFHEHDMRTAELMAGLLREAIGQATELEWKKNLQAERTQMLAALDQLRPQLEKLVSPVAATAAQNASPAKSVAVQAPIVLEDAAEPQETNASETLSVAHSVPPSVPDSTDAPDKSQTVLQGNANPAPNFEADVSTADTNDSEWQPITGSVCRHCGAKFAQEEFFCGSCGHALFAPEDVEAKRSLWVMQQQSERHAESQSSPPAPRTENVMKPDTGAGLPDALQAIFDQYSHDDLSVADKPAASHAAEPVTTPEHEAQPPATEESTDGSSVPAPAPWSSAAKTKEWLESQKVEEKESPLQMFWQQHRANLYLGASLLLLLIVLFSGSSKTGLGGAQPKLTMFEQLLVSLGLAEAPQTPQVYHGNPSTQVWVDVHTALYYCPGADSYGKTQNGRYTTQKDAQQDQFEPAAGKACD